MKTIDPNFPNPYLPGTDEETVALAKFNAVNSQRFDAGLRRAFGEGILANSASEGSVEEARFELLWDHFIDTDIELPRSYPTSADTFIAGYRAATSELAIA